MGHQYEITLDSGRNDQIDDDGRRGYRFDGVQRKESYDGRIQWSNCKAENCYMMPILWW